MSCPYPKEENTKTKEISGELYVPAIGTLRLRENFYGITYGFDHARDRKLCNGFHKRLPPNAPFNKEWALIQKSQNAKNPSLREKFLKFF